MRCYESKRKCWSECVCAGIMCEYTYKNKLKHHTSILDHPLQDVWCKESKEFIRQTRPLHLLTAPCHEEAVSASASCGFLDAEGIATERNPAAAHMQNESTDDEISGASDYGTLA